MAPYRRTFQYEILTPRGEVTSGKAVSAVLPSQDGQVGVLGGRAPLAVVIGGGLLVVETEASEREHFYAANGFAQTREGRLTVVVEECTPLSQIDPEAAYAEMERLRRRPVTGEGLEPLYQTELMRLARLRFNLAQRFRRGDYTRTGKHGAQGHGASA
jgi:F-type H+-transporting ATPase subunit epsilon